MEINSGKKPQIISILAGKESDGKKVLHKLLNGIT